MKEDEAMVPKGMVISPQGKLVPVEHPTWEVQDHFGGTTRPAKLTGFTDEGYPMYEGGGVIRPPVQ